MSNEYKKSEEIDLVSDANISDSRTEIPSTVFQTGNYNTLVLFIDLSYQGTPEKLEITLYNILDSSDTEYKAFNRNVIEYDYTDIPEDGKITAEIRVVTQKKSKLNITCPTLTAGNAWVFSIKGVLIEETSATDQIAIY